MGRQFRAYRSLVEADLFRYGGKVDFKTFLKRLLLQPGFQYTFWMRTAAYACSKAILWKPLSIIARMMLRHYRYKYDLLITYTSQVGGGLYISHIGTIIVNQRAAIGKDCTICSGVTIGSISRGKRTGVPVIGERVYISHGAKILGAVRVGDDAIIGANCVVIDDVPANGVVVGVPGRIISLEGSGEYIKYATTKINSATQLQDKTVVT
jgi:serine O-acetyltransferase